MYSSNMSWDIYASWDAFFEWTEERFSLCIIPALATTVHPGIRLHLKNCSQILVVGLDQNSVRCLIRELRLFAGSGQIQLELRHLKLNTFSSWLYSLRQLSCTSSNEMACVQAYSRRLQFNDSINWYLSALRGERRQFSFYSYAFIYSDFSR